jgi:TRAP-type mannitol/chloroaromatic compound transport system substrate-binding protein
MSVIETGNYDHLSPTELKAVQDAAKEAAKSLMRSDAEKDVRNGISAMVKEEFKIGKSDFNDLVNRYHRQDKEAVTAKRENQNALFDKVFPEGKKADPEADANE